MKSHFCARKPCNELLCLCSLFKSDLAIKMKEETCVQYYPGIMRFQATFLHDLCGQISGGTRQHKVVYAPKALTGPKLYAFVPRIYRTLGH
jgi:hypothetical protein